MEDDQFTSTICRKTPTRLPIVQAPFNESINNKKQKNEERISTWPQAWCFGSAGHTDGNFDIPGGKTELVPRCQHSWRHVRAVVGLYRSRYVPLFQLRSCMSSIDRVITSLPSFVVMAWKKNQHHQVTLLEVGTYTGIIPLEITGWPVVNIGCLPVWVFAGVKCPPI